MSSKSPVIRFNGFTDDWEQRKLNKLAEFAKGSGYSKSDLKSEGTPAIHYGRLYTNYETLIKEVDTFVEAKENSIISKGDEVIVPASGETSEDISRASVVVKPGIVLGGDLNIIKPNPLINSAFLALTISNGDQQKELTRRAQGKSVVHIRNSDLKEVNLFYPKIDEQNKIGIFFEKLEDTIALHQRELDNLIKSKKGFLQKMFPKQGGKVPEVRFSKFAKDWKQHDLKDIYKKSNEKNKNLKYEKEYIISVAKMQYKENDSVSSEDYMKTYNVMKKNDIAFEGNKSKKYKYGRFVLNDIGDGIVSHVFIVMRPKMEMSASFLKEYINNESVMQQILLFSTTSTLMMTTLNTKEFLEQKLRLPSLEEQLEIGSFFEELDSSIFLKQKQLNNLKQTKKAFLQKMFV